MLTVGPKPALAVQRVNFKPVCISLCLRCLSCSKGSQWLCFGRMAIRAEPGELGSAWQGQPWSWQCGRDGTHSQQICPRSGVPASEGEQLLHSAAEEGAGWKRRCETQTWLFPAIAGNHSCVHTWANKHTQSTLQCHAEMPVRQPRKQGCLLPSVPWWQCSHHKHRHFS